MTKSDTWYVAYTPDKSARPEGKASSSPVRITKTFKSEAEAKAFAIDIIARGWTVSAGTLNPHQPKQTIAAAVIEKWADPKAL